MTCDDVDLLLAAAAVQGGVDPDDLDAVRAHTATCRRCARAAAQYVQVADLLAIAVEPVQPPATLRTRILAEVYAGYGPSPAPQRRGAPQLPAWFRRLWVHVPSGRGFTLGGVAAAAAAVALLVITTAGSGRTTTLRGPQSADVRGTVNEPAVAGTVTYYPQTQTTVIDVRGLAPQSPAQHVYEVWLVRPDNEVTAAGFLTEQPDGSWTFAMRGSMHGYSSVAATVEPPGGSRTPTGEMVLTGSLPTT